MTSADEKELHRLSDMLATIDSMLPIHSQLHEGLKKAGLAMAFGFIRGMRTEIEHHYEHLDAPLSEEQRQNLIRMGIDPDI